MWRTKAAALFVLLALAGCSKTQLTANSTREERMAAWDKEEQSQKQLREFMNRPVDLENDDPWYAGILFDSLVMFLDACFVVVTSPLRANS